MRLSGALFNEGHFETFCCVVAGHDELEHRGVWENLDVTKHAQCPVLRADNALQVRKVGAELLEPERDV